MSEQTSDEKFKYLERLDGTLEASPRSCDLCCDSEIQDIIEKPDADLLGGELRPMYRDVRDGITVCLRCAEAGAYLEIDP